MIEFDPEKEAANIAKHGVSLARAKDMVFGEALIETDQRFDYRESRWLAYGELGDRLYVLVFTRRDDVTRAISLRRANQREIRYVESCRRL